MAWLGSQWLNSEISYWWLVCGRETQKNTECPQRMRSPRTVLGADLLCVPPYLGRGRDSNVTAAVKLGRCPKSPWELCSFIYWVPTTCSTKYSRHSAVYCVPQILLDTEDMGASWLPVGSAAWRKQAGQQGNQHPLCFLIIPGWAKGGLQPWVRETVYSCIIITSCIISIWKTVNLLLPHPAFAPRKPVDSVDYNEKEFVRYFF